MPIKWRDRSPESKERDNLRRALSRATGKPRGSRGKARKRPITFIAVDGEGVTRDDGTHDYVLLAASNHTSVERWEDNGLSTAECIEYLLRLKRENKHATFVGFSFGYDSNMILRDIIRPELERIADGEYAMICNRKYLVRFIAGKSLYVGRGHQENGKWKTDEGVTIWDVWGFFQCSFVRALRDWGTCSAETIDIIERMKNKRGEFDDEMRGLITGYCFRECELLVKLMTEFKRVADEAGIKLTRWDGAGACAAALLRQHDMKQHIAPSRDIPAEVYRASLYAYFGGRIEIFGCGVVDGPTYEYDINSAYPSEIASLPSMEGEWKRVIHPNPAQLNPWGLYHVKWADDARSCFGPFPWRDGAGSIYFPNAGEGWYHAIEVRAALMTFACIDVIDGWEFTPATKERPFDWVRDLYAQRQQYKATGDARGIVIKLGLNAMYGKLAQSVGFRNGQPPAYQSFYLAGRVTAGTRAKMLIASRVAGNNLISIMTDALFSRQPIALPQSNELGEWSETKLSRGLLVIQPGVVLSPNAETDSSIPFARSRGFSRNSIDYDTARAAWDSGGFLGKFTIRERRFIGMGRALAAQRLIEWDIDKPDVDVMGNLISEQWRRWVEIEKTISFAANLRKHDTYQEQRSPLWFDYLPPTIKGMPQLGQIYEPDNAENARYSVHKRDSREQPGGEYAG